jgi:hypothetical protein
LQEATTAQDTTTFETTTGQVDQTTTEKVRKAQLRKINYVPQFVGSYGPPSPFWTARSPIQNP